MRVLMICPELPSDNSPGSMAPGARQIRSIREAGLDVHVVDMRGIPKLKYLQVLPKIRGHLKRVDIIHAHFGYCGWLALLARRTPHRKVPIVMSFMGDDLLGTPYNAAGDLERWSLVAANWNKSIASRYDQVIVKSQEMADRLNPISCHVIPNGVDTTVFHPINFFEANHLLGRDPTKLKVLFPGNPANPRKGYALAASAVELASQKLNRGIELVLLWGVQPDQVALYMNACNAMLMTSLIEGSPNVVKEALACDQCIVAVPVGDAHQLIQGVSGCHCTQRDPQQIALALSEILSSTSRSSGRSAIEAKGLTLSQVAQQVINVYQEALNIEQYDRNKVIPVRPAQPSHHSKVASTNSRQVPS
ncbi:MAG TPA: hypothetical protein DCF63_11595 [Planctomycetaceae bacterium]|nr:hypothetical protein [Planctomycetaceae bacterium]